MSSSHILTAVFIAGGVYVVTKFSHSLWQVAGGILLLIGMAIAVMNDFETKLEKEASKEVE